MAGVKPHSRGTLNKPTGLRISTLGRQEAVAYLKLMGELCTTLARNPAALLSTVFMLGNGFMGQHCGGTISLGEAERFSFNASYQGTEHDLSSAFRRTIRRLRTGENATKKIRSSSRRRRPTRKSTTRTRILATTSSTRTPRGGTTRTSR